MTVEFSTASDIDFQLLYITTAEFTTEITTITATNDVESFTMNCILQSSATPTPESMKEVEKYEINFKDVGVINMTGLSVYGVTEGSFDAEYLITVMIGNDGSLLQGIVFLHGNITPIMVVNDVAPQAKMYLTISEMEYQNQVNAIEIIPRPKTVVMPNSKDVKRQSIDICPVVPCKPPSIMPRTSSILHWEKRSPLKMPQAKMKPVR